MTAPDQSSTPVEREIKRLLGVAGEDGQTNSYRGKRRTERVAIALQLEATADPDKASAVWAVTMHDISEGGISFWSRPIVPLRTSIYVRHFSAEDERIWLPATVTHCTVGIRGYLVGAAFNLATEAGPVTANASSNPKITGLPC